MPAEEEMRDGVQMVDQFARPYVMYTKGGQTFVDPLGTGESGRVLTAAGEGKTIAVDLEAAFSGEIPRMGAGRMLLYSIGGLAVMQLFTLTSWMPFFAIKTLDISPLWVGLLVAVYGAWNAVNDVFLGNRSDVTRSRYGRRRPWVLGGALPSFALFVAVFNPARRWDEGVLIAWLFVTTMSFNFVYSGLETAYFSSYYDQFPPEQRATGNATRMVFLFLAAGAGTTLPPALGGTDMDKDLLPMSLVIGGVSFVAAVLCALVMRDPDSRSSTTVPKSTNIVGGLKQMIGDPNTRSLIVADLSINLAITSTLQSFPFYFETVIGAVEGTSTRFHGSSIDAETQITLLLASLLVTTLLSLPCWAQVCKRGGLDRPRQAAMMSAALTGAVSLYFLLVPNDFGTALGGMIAFGAVLPGILVAINMLLADALDAGELEHGSRCEGVLNGALQFTQKILSIPVLFVLPVVLEATGYDSEADKQDDDTKWGIRAVFSVIPLVGSLFAAWALHRHPLQGERLAEMVSTRRKRLGVSTAAEGDKGADREEMNRM